MDKHNEWTCDANDAVEISMVEPGDDGQKLTARSTFYPQFTYPLFGDEESIFGYRKLNIELRFAAHDLQSHLQISYDEKFKQVEDIKAVDLLRILKPYLPEASFSTFDEFKKRINDGSAPKFTPPGKLVHSYSRDEKDYEIWAGSLADPEVRKTLDRIQIFVSFFIEGGTPIETDDFDWTLERWIIYFVYEKHKKPSSPKASRYSFAGYATTYRWYFFHPKSSNDAKLGYESQKTDAFDSFPVSKIPARLRIAQFLIIKPYQHAGHGSQLYRTIQKACLDDPTLFELTIEDPNESFDALRDSNDYHMLKPEFIKNNISINPNLPNTTPGASFSNLPKHPRVMPTSLLIPTKTLDDLRQEFKIAPTQFAHLVEMYLLSQVPESHRGAENVNMTRLTTQKSRMQNEHDRRYYWWRMLVKQRLYKRHRDMLIQIDKDERVVKLDETLQNVEEGYDVLLKAFDERPSGSGKGKGKARVQDGADDDTEGVSEAPISSNKKRSKRKFTVEEDDEDDEMVDAQPAKNGGGKKKPKV
ncbi:histone acetyltransferase type B catalytic subunit [Nannizzia gypsea CBS 118893]|uniref:Histone acetyltransferase type B catalytic subunit n=1 Tax=Arthroderma gypseum (strain ATCC MYA-4604 / CBS 118893) TaxID=535722 RepID=E4UMP5_ARTGP|nr:histone acetyltransferase type B catalytic subunit [Nannizzia gypsea CBS 118893]EFQ99462.1 histone acetyltransferase type B catalytic subunit [Nannizzia gypsea CBS 118893]